MFCPAAQRAWETLSGSNSQWWLGWLDPRNLSEEHLRRVLKFNHSIAFLVCAIGQVQLPDEDTGVKLLLKQAVGYQPSTPLALEHIGPLEDTSIDQIRDRRHMWIGPVAHHDASEPRCPSCSNIGRSKARTWHGTHSQRKARCNSATPAATLCATQDIPDNTPIFTLRTLSIPACWPFNEQGPLGTPLTQAEAPDNCCWQSSRCPECRAWRLVAIATKDIQAGDLLRAPLPPFTSSLPEWSPAEYRVSFDGGARHSSGALTLDRNGPRAVGAGAILWGPANERGQRCSSAQIALSAPSLSSSLVAEALGLRAGLALVKLKTKHPGRLEVVGDNLPVLKVAAANGKIRTPEVWQALEAPLIHAATHGWLCEWTAVRRIYNTAADHVATQGTCAAVEAAYATDLNPVLRIWEEHPSGELSGQLPWFHGWQIDRAQQPFWTPTSTDGAHEQGEPPCQHPPPPPA